MIVNNASNVPAELGRIHHAPFNRRKTAKLSKYTIVQLRPNTHELLVHGRTMATTLSVLVAALGGWQQYFAHASISFRRFSNRSPR